tara:strand:+ start:13301 stop:15145 length:1845 start_codon:yes stop_codon:yes gene_type:complete
MSVLDKLTEGIVHKNVQKEGTALLEKWERTGLLEGINNDSARNGMARLLENQAAQLLREASSMAAGDVEGFASVAFPIVRRVFGGLIANDLVSVQPMSLPSGLIFFMDFQFNGARGGHAANDSLYGGGVVGNQLTGGVNLDGENAEKSFYALNNGHSSPTGSATFALIPIASGVLGDGAGDDVADSVTAASLGASTVSTSLSKLCRFDPDLQGQSVVVCTVTGAVSLDDGTSRLGLLNRNNLVAMNAVTEVAATDGAGSTSLASDICRVTRRLTTLAGGAAANAATSINGLGTTAADTSYVLVFAGTASAGGAGDTDDMITHLTSKRLTVTFPMEDNFDAANALGSVIGVTPWGLEGEDAIPEIDIKVDSIAVTAITKKLKAKWTPELGQDLNAYHNLDAEVELTSILSEQIALEIDREILNDLVQGASAGTLHWSRRPGRFLNRESGAAIAVAANIAGPDFTGTVSEWYETLVETINDVSARIHRKTLRGGANFVVVSPEVANVLEFTAGFRASVTADSDTGTVGAVKVGSLSKKWDVYVDPYFLRNVVLVGRKGGSFLESGYVYAPYVPLQVTPTIFGTEDFVPRKGVMTRYAKKMVRPDMYGLVICQDLIG